MNKIILLFLMLLSFNAHAVCQLDRPHSFDCQNETFQGRIFPLRPLNFDVLNENWHSNQYTSAPGVAALFQTVSARSRPNRTCALINLDRSRVGNMRFVMGRHEIKAVQITQLGAKGRTFQSTSKVTFENENSVIFGGKRERFRCRIFVRVGIEHMSCQMFVDGIFKGYLGFLPMAVGC